MIILGQVLRLLERSSRVSEGRKDELRFLFELDRRLRKELLFQRVVLLFLASIFIFAILILGISLAELFTSGQNQALALGLCYVVLIAPVIWELWEPCGQHLSWEKLLPTPVSQETMALYRNLAFLSVLTFSSLLVSLFLTALAWLADPGAGSLGEFFLAFVRLVLATFLVLTLPPALYRGLPALFRRNEKLELASTLLSLYSFLFLVFGFLFLVLDFLSRLNPEESLEFLWSLPLVKVLLVLYIASAYLIIGELSLFQALTFVSISLGFILVLEWVKLVGDMASAAKEPRADGKTKKEKIPKAAAPPDQDSPRETENFMFKKGMPALDSLKELRIRRKEGEKLRKGFFYLLYICLAAGTCWLYPYAPYFSVGLFGCALLYIYTMVDVSEETTSAPSHFLRIIPERPEELEEHLFGNLVRNFLKVYYITSLPTAILATSPLWFPLAGDYLRFDTVAVLILLTIIPLLACGTLLLFPDIAFFSGSKNSWGTEALSLLGYIFLLLLYLLLLSGSFNFLGNIVLSWLFHLLVALCFLNYRRASLKQSVLSYLYAGRPPKKPRYSPGPEKASRFLFKLRHDPTITVACGIISMLLIAIFIIAPTDWEEPQPAIIEKERVFHMGPVPEENIVVYSEDEIIENETLEPEMSIIINASVHFVNSSIIFQDEEPGALGIYVLENGSLTLENCNLSSKSYFIFEVYGDIETANSNISKLRGSKKHPDRDGGIELYGNARDHDAVFVKTRITNCQTNGIMAGPGSDPTILNCSFRNISGDGIEFQDSGGVVLGCDISDCHVGIYMRNADPYIGETRIKQVEDNTYLKTGDSRPILEDNHFNEPIIHGEGLDFAIDETSLQILVLVLPAVLTLAIFFLFGSVEKAKKEEEKTTEPDSTGGNQK